MAELVVHVGKIKENIRKISSFLSQHGKEWSLITKVFSGDQGFIKHILSEDLGHCFQSVGDSRLTSLKNIKAVNPALKTIYIKPPAAIYADDIVRYADISLNSSFSTIIALNEAAKKADKIHEIIIMVELGELREGVLREDILNFYERVFNLSNIEVLGLGSNLGCMYGVEPNYDKLLQLGLYQNLISIKFNKELKLVSGGTSITLPLIDLGKLPQDINHFRIGEAAFFGTSPLRGEQFMDLHEETFEFYGNIIELEEKENIPDGIIGEGNIGQAKEFREGDARKTYKAILDFGLIDVDRENIDVLDKGVSFFGMTSDMLVVDLGKNRKPDGSFKYKVGDQIRFKPNYMAVVRLLNSKFIDTRFIEEEAEQGLASSDAELGQQIV